MNINLVRGRPPSELNSVIEKLYRSTYYSTPEFGEETGFTQRLTGFFVPPVSCLYTLNLRSDDLSRLYFSRNASSTNLPDTPLISVTEHTRFRYDNYEPCKNCCSFNSDLFRNYACSYSLFLPFQACTCYAYFRWNILHTS